MISGRQSHCTCCLKPNERNNHTYDSGYPHLLMWINGKLGSILRQVGMLSAVRPPPKTPRPRKGPDKGAVSPKGCAHLLCRRSDRRERGRPQQSVTPPLTARPPAGVRARVTVRRSVTCSRMCTPFVLKGKRRCHQMARICRDPTNTAPFGWR
jgi:hypothetical protein